MNNTRRFDTGLLNTIEEGEKITWFNKELYSRQIIENANNGTFNPQDVLDLLQLIDQKASATYKQRYQNRVFDLLGEAINILENKIKAGLTINYVGLTTLQLRIAENNGNLLTLIKEFKEKLLKQISQKNQAETQKTLELKKPKEEKVDLEKLIELFNKYAAEKNSVAELLNKIRKQFSADISAKLTPLQLSEVLKRYLKLLNKITGKSATEVVVQEFRKEIEGRIAEIQKETTSRPHFTRQTSNLLQKITTRNK